ncbi:hypothetical protein [Streptomyces yaizuensis]|uniref:Uncharacterized protein n=1 Tax=Streptomyces yaizuensis TaxID=2989713 RepID=A0ABQ5NYJ6_9ACTN|nr:hypothetical protein [Streptomyces sp. YSPA8]GLF95433.1 hypothetical protein SYYSPA8_14070 [Streptomyces sp. YSPA8]
MHTAADVFVLDHWREKKKQERPRSGWTGTSPEFGAITVEYPVERVHGETVTAEVRGGLIPTASFASRGMHTAVVEMPTLNGATCRVGDALVTLSRNRLGVTRGARALHLRLAGDRYRLTADGGRSYVLTREPDDEDPGVTIRAGESGRGRGRRLTVHVTGRAVAADISLAVLFAGVDRSTLTRGGAVRAGVSRAVNLTMEAKS